MSMGGVCCFLSGFLEFFQPGWRFVVVAVAIRIVHATGNAMVITATFTYSAMEFANDVGKVFVSTFSTKVREKWILEVYFPP